MRQSALAIAAALLLAACAALGDDRFRKLPDAAEADARIIAPDAGVDAVPAPDASAAADAALR